jgi:hypothetical protein
MNGDYVRVWKEAVVTYFKAVPNIILERLEKTMKTIHSG